MELFNSIYDMASFGWGCFFGTMTNYSAAYPMLALFTFLGLLIGMVYLTVKEFMKPKKTIGEILDINARIENPAWYTNIIIFLVSRTVLLPFYLLSLVAIAAMKIYFYFVIKSCAFKDK